jgi:hypothetical protein
MSYRVEKNQAGNQEIVISGWENGIANSALEGIQDIRGMNVSDMPGICYTIPNSTVTAIAPNSQETDFAGFVKTFTASNSGGELLITFSTYPRSIATSIIAVTFTNSGGALPTGLVAGTQYYLVYATDSQNYFVATSYINATAGTTINYTDSGTGTHTATSVNMGNCTCATIDPRTSTVYTVDSNGRVWNDLSGWQLIDGNTLTNATGNGISVYNDWLFVFRNRSIDVYGPLSSAIGSRAWYNGWKTMNQSAGDSTRHDTIIGQDATLYWTDYDSTTAYDTRGYIGSLRPVAGQLLFADTNNPSTSSSVTNYTFNSQALDFSVYEQPVALEEIGNNLVIGVNGYLYGFEKGYSKIYTWDRVSPSYNSPLFLPENPIVDMVNLNNIIYIFGGNRGRIYRTNLSSVEFVRKIPDTMYIPDTAGIEGNPLRGSNANFTFSSNVCVARDRIWFGLGGLAGGSAVYSYDPSKDVLKVENRVTVGTYGLTFTALNIPCVIAPGSTLEVMYSWSYNSVYGWDSAVPTGSATSTFYSYIITDNIPVSTKVYPKNFGEVEWKTITPLGPSDQIRVSFRTMNNVAFTTIGTTSYSASLPTQISDEYTANIENAEWVQFKIEFSSTNTTGSTGIMFKELRLR